MDRIAGNWIKLDQNIKTLPHQWPLNLCNRPDGIWFRLKNSRQQPMWDCSIIIWEKLGCWIYHCDKIPRRHSKLVDTELFIVNFAESKPKVSTSA